jgi:alpha-L-rhamnosidase
MTAQPAPREGAKASSVWAGPQPSLSWAPVHDQVAAQVRLSSPAGLIWESGIVQTDLPELAYHGPRLPGRTVHTWQVRTLDGAGLWSDWKAGQAFETALLRPSDWSAQWISREVPDSTRVIRSMPGDRVEWVGPGSTLSQPFTVLGDCLGAAIDLRFEDQGSPSGRVRLTTTAGEVLAETVIADLGFPPDRFSTTIVADPPLPPGSYLVQLEVDSGHIGWTHGVSEAPPVPGVSPIPLTESHIRDGEVGPGSLALGVDVTPAPAPEFRQVFRLPDRPVRARLYGTGLGYGTFFVNGQRVGDAVLEPAQTDYSHSVAYSAHDVTALLNAGSNEISVRTGRGFWSVRGVNVWGWNLASWSSEPAVIAQLEIDDATGQRTTIASGPDWSTRASDITSDLLYTGITQLHGALEHCWAPATIVPGPEGALKLGSAPPVVEAAPIRALPAADRASSDHVHDFGRVIAGTVRLTLRANGPGAVSVKYGEYLNEAGSVECENILTSGQAQVDRLEFAAASEGLTWQPEFTYKGFRYVAVQLEGGVELSDITAVPYVSRLEVTGSFDCDEQTLCWIENATAATLLNNLHGVPTDTPAYEKNGWTADGHLIAESAMRRFDLRSFLTKWLDDHVDSADEMGVVPQIVPTPGWGRRIDPAWSGSLILLAWNLYWEYGDSEVIHRYLKPMTRYLDRALEIAADADWIWPLHSWGDWLAPGTGPAPEGSAPVSTMSVLQLADRLSRMAALVGETAMAATYLDARQNLAAAYHRAYFDREAGLYAVDGVGYRQTMNAMPLALGAVPESETPRVLDALVLDIQQRTSGHLDCGAIGVKHVLPALSGHGRVDLALTIATQRTEPSWGAWMSSGNGTLWEAWSDSRSRNHFFLGSVGAWLHENVGGLVQSAAGWRQFVVRPPDDDRVRRGSASHSSLGRTAAAAWTRSDHTWDVSVAVPPASRALLSLPGHDAQELLPGEHHFRLPVERTSPSRL